MRLLTAAGYGYLLRGLEQQLWFLGQDVLHAAGGRKNLLVQHGFEKFKPPFQQGSSRYRTVWKGRTVELHSFCVGIYGAKADGFLYIRAKNLAAVYCGRRPPWPGRYRDALLFQPRWGWIEEEARFHRAASVFLEWLDDYETWVEREMGADYRAGCYRRYHQEWLPPEEVRDWFRLYRDAPGSALKRIA